MTEAGKKCKANCKRRTNPQFSEKKITNRQNDESDKIYDILKAQNDIVSRHINVQNDQWKIEKKQERVDLFSWLSLGFAAAALIISLGIMLVR